MTTFIRTIDEGAWTAVEKGWTAPVDPEENPKDTEEWTAAEITLSGMNQKAINAIQSDVSIEIFSLISTFQTVKEAWLVLKNTFEENRRVKGQRVQQLVTQFENLKMEEDETIVDFHTKLRAIVNECTLLGEQIIDSKVVRKILRSLPERFNYKVAALEKTRDLDNYSFGDLIATLRIFEMGLCFSKTGKKELGFQGFQI